MYALRTIPTADECLRLRDQVFGSDAPSSLLGDVDDALAGALTPPAVVALVEAAGLGDEDAVASFRALTPSERYCLLLDAWLFVLADAALAPDGSTEVGATRLWSLGDAPADDARLDLLVRFGLLADAAGDHGATAFGEAMWCWLWAAVDYDAVEPGRPSPTAAWLAPFRDDIRSGLVFGEVADRVEATWTIRVTFGDAWRRLDAPAAVPVDELAPVVLRAFGFDLDHAWCFRSTGIETPPATAWSVGRASPPLSRLLRAPGDSSVLAYGEPLRWSLTLTFEGPAPAAVGAPVLRDAEGVSATQYGDDEWL